MKYSLSVLAFICAFTAIADDAFNGRWMGHAERNGVKTPIEFELFSGPDGYYGTRGMPEFGWTSTPLESVTREGDAIVMSYDGGAFNGTVDGSTISGTWTFRDGEAAFSVQRSNEPTPFTREEIVFENDGITFGGVVYVPRSSGPHPLLVAWHGSGDSERWHNAYWAEFFASRGVAFCIWDKRGNGASGGDWQKAGFDAYARDGLKAVELLKKRSDIDASRIGAFGISQACWIMPVAAQLSGDISFIIAISGAQVTVEEEGFFDYIVQLRDQGFSEEDQAKVLTMLKMDNHVTRTGEGYEDLLAFRKEHRREPWMKAAKFTPPPPDAESRNFYRLIIDHDPVPILKVLELPFLFIYGSADKSVEADRSVRVLKSIQEEMDKDYTIHVFEGANHGIRIPPKKDDAWQLWRHAPGYADAMIDWLRDRGYAPTP